MDHLDRPRLARLLRGSGPSEEAWSSVVHLSGCLGCTRALVELFPEEGRAFLMRAAQTEAPEAGENAWGARVELWLRDGWTRQRQLSCRGELEIEQAPQLAAVLPEDPGGAALVARNRSGFGHLGLAAYLLAEAQEKEGAPEGRHLAERSARVLEAIAPQVAQPTAWDLAARARLRLALEAIRQGDRILARSCFAAAREHLSRGAGAPEERAAAEQVHLEILWRSAPAREVMDAAREAAAAFEALPAHLAGLHRTLSRVALEPPEPHTAADTHASEAFRAWLALPRPQQLAVVGWLAAVATPAWVRRLLAEARTFWRQDARQAEELARLATVMAEAALDAGAVFDTDSVLAARAIARGYLAGSLRAQRRFREAERELAAGWDWLGQVEAPAALDRAWMLRIRSSLLMDLQKFSEAQRAAHQAQKLFFYAGDRREGLWMVVAETIILAESREGIQEGLALLSEWESEFTPGELGKAGYWAVLHLKACLYAWSGESFKALGLLQELRGLAATLDEWHFSARLAWLEALVYQALGQGDKAQLEFCKARDTFLEKGLWADACLVMLDIAELALRRGQPAEAKRIVLAAGPLLAAHGIAREALAAIQLFAATASQEGLSLQLIVQTRHQVQKHKVP